ncbi:MAG: hypothetical protein WC796_05485 [Candidatus Pacearchaeota archaeon]|jgi:hypothetical protein
MNRQTKGVLTEVLTLLGTGAIIVTTMLGMPAALECARRHHEVSQRLEERGNNYFPVYILKKELSKEGDAFHPIDRYNTPSARDYFSKN